MANTKEIKSRMEGIGDTQKITNAMYLIASTKLQKAKADLDRTRPYFSALQAEIKRIFRTSESVESIFFYPADGSSISDGAYGCLVVTADKGLAGAYNQNVIKLACELLDDHPNTELFVVGEYGRQYFQNHKIPIEKSFLYTAQNPTMDRAREIASFILERYVKGEFTKFFIIYTDATNSIETQAKSTRLLPFHRAQFYGEEETKETQFEFEPSLLAVLDNVMPSYVSGFIYSALIDSFCSEQEARMTAMDSANQNAEKLLDKLSAEYNRVRQSGITNEITEISAGAKAQKRKRQNGGTAV